MRSQFAALLCVGVVTGAAIDARVLNGFPRIPGQPQTVAKKAGSLTVREVATGDQSNVDAGREVVIRNRAEWEKLWREHDYDRPVPAVDFSKEMVIAIFLGSQTSAGYGIRITEVVSTSGALVVSYQVSRPTPGGVAAMVLTFPFQIVAAPATPGTARFERLP